MQIARNKVSASLTAFSGVECWGVAWCGGDVLEETQPPSLKIRDHQNDNATYIPNNFGLFSLQISPSKSRSFYKCQSINAGSMGATNRIHEEGNSTSIVVPHCVVTCKNKILLFLFTNRRLTVFSLCDVTLSDACNNIRRPGSPCDKTLTAVWNLLRATFLATRMLRWLVVL